MTSRGGLYLKELMAVPPLSKGVSKCGGMVYKKGLGGHYVSRLMNLKKAGKRVDTSLLFCKITTVKVVIKRRRAVIKLNFKP